jgi:peptide methionine sulfoxide reductase MsrB
MRALTQSKGIGEGNINVGQTKDTSEQGLLTRGNVKGSACSEVLSHVWQDGPRKVDTM